MEIRSVLTTLSAEQAAKRLLGSELIRTIDGMDVRVKIVETEAYDQSDAASHSYRGRTPRTDVMFGPAGYIYVYFTYGMHYCMNIVVGPEAHGAAVLIRAVEPLSNVELLRQNRPQTGVALTNGPAKLCQALRIDKRLNGHDAQHPPLRLTLRPELRSDEIVRTTRIGITKAADVTWRFFIEANSYVSKTA